jgi:hypothetical protein
MPELIQTLQAYKKKENEDRKFLASLKGIKIDEEEEQEGPSFEDIQRRVMGVDADKDDILSLQGTFAQNAGFGIGAGLGYTKE